MDCVILLLPLLLIMVNLVLLPLHWNSEFTFRLASCGPFCQNIDICILQIICTLKYHNIFSLNLKPWLDSFSCYDN